MFVEVPVKGAIFHKLKTVISEIRKRKNIVGAQQKPKNFKYPHYNSVDVLIPLAAPHWRLL